MTEDTCFGNILGGNIYAERCCGDCLSLGACSSATARNKKEEIKMTKKALDPKWVAELMGYILGPQMTVMMMKSPKSAKNLTEIIHSAVTDMYENNDFPDTNAWVEEASNRVWELYNTYITVRLIEMFDKGVPDVPIIHLVPGSKIVN